MTALALPSARDEAWRWADLAGLAAAARSPRRTADAAQDLFLPLDGPRLLFLDGAFQPERSDPGPVRIGPLALDTAHALGRHARAAGWRLELARDASPGPIQIVHLSTGGENHLPGELLLADGAAATLIETFAGRGWANRLVKARLAPAARLQHAVRLLQADGFVSRRDEAALDRGASFVATHLAAGDMGARIDAAATLDAGGAYAEVGGALLARGEGKVEAAAVIRHAAPEGMSRQLWRLVAAHRAVASAAARVEVARHAQRTDGEQSLRGLLLDRTATVNLKPELEIFADDVKCAHGATVGELDRQALFYLASRGLPPGPARALLTRAFVGDALARIGDETVREAFAADADRWLAAAP